MEVLQGRKGELPVATVRGRVDHANAEVFKRALAPLLEQCCEGEAPLLLDLSQLEYISSAGLRVLMLAARQVSTQGGTLVMAALQPVVAEIFRISRFDLVFRVYPDVDSAVAALSPANSEAS